METESPNRSARRFFGASIASTRAAPRTSPAADSGSRSRSIWSCSTAARSTSKASLGKGRPSSSAFQSVFPIPLCLPKRRVELFRNKKALIDQLHRGPHIAAEIIILVAIELEDATLRERNVRSDKTLPRLREPD